MKIISCLGNPEKRYAKTRHNIGFILGEFMAGDLGITLNKKMFSSITGTGKHYGIDLMMLFPQTYMNSSGDAVAQALGYYKEEPQNLIVIHDEIELPFGEFRTKFGGGHKGHNGLRSIISRIGTADFHRIRFGVGRPDNPNMEVADYVLSNFSKEEIDKVKELLPGIMDIIIPIIEKD
ncbi:aminoacyl-tRNA hydrolase [Spirochaetota bacterium]